MEEGERRSEEDRHREGRGEDEDSCEGQEDAYQEDAYQEDAHQEDAHQGEAKRRAKRRASKAVSSHENRAHSYFRTRRAFYVTTAIIFIPYPKRSSQKTPTKKTQVSSAVPIRRPLRTTSSFGAASKKQHDKLFSSNFFDEEDEVS